jgi:hypothetical protein
MSAEDMNVYVESDLGNHVRVDTINLLLFRGAWLQGQGGASVCHNTGGALPRAFDKCLAISDSRAIKTTEHML